MRSELELRELRLAEDGPFDVLQIVAEQRQLDGRVFDLLQHLVDEERLVERRRDLGDEGRITCGRERLRPVREEAVHRVAELVRQGADVGVLAVVVQQHVRVDVVRGAVRVRARALAVVRVQIDPAFGEGALRAGRVFLAERRERIQHACFGFVGGVGQVDRGHERSIEVVVMQLRHLQHPLTEFEVAMKGREVVVDAVDEARVHGRRDIRAVECGLQSAVVFPRLRVEHVALYLRAQRRAEGGFVLTERREERRHDLLTILPVRHAAVHAERRAVEPHALAITQRDCGVGKVGVGQDAVDRRRPIGQYRGARQQAFSSASVPVCARRR